MRPPFALLVLLALLAAPPLRAGGGRRATPRDTAGRAADLVIGTGFDHREPGVWRTPGAPSVWRQRVHNAGTDSLFVLTLRNPNLRDLRVRWTREDGRADTLRTGTRYGWRRRPVPAALYHLPLRLDPGATAELELRLDPGGFRTRTGLVWRGQAAWERSRQRRTMVLAFYLAGAAFTLAFGFLILAFIRAYIRYAYGYFFAAALSLVATGQGIGFALLWPRAPGWQAVAEPLLFAATMVGALRFVQRLLRTASGPALHAAMFALQAGFVALAAGALWVPGRDPGTVALWQDALDAWTLLGVGGLVAAPIWRFARTRRPEPLGLLASTAVLLGTLAAQAGDGLDWWRAGDGLERGLWAGMVLLHAGITALIVRRMRQVVLEQARAKAALEAERTRLLRTLVLQEEAERVRLGADLHDEAGARFAALKMALSGWAWDSADPAERAALEAVAADVDALCKANRDLAHQLLAVSLDKLGLADALAAYRQRLLRRGRHLVIRAAEEVWTGHDETAGLLLHRVVQELAEGVYATASELRIVVDNLPGGREWRLTVEPLDEPLPEPDPESAAYRGLVARVALFHEGRERPVEARDGRLRVWLPRRVAAGA